MPSAINFPVFIFCQDRLFISDQSIIWAAGLLELSESVEVFDSSARALRVLRQDDRLILSVDSDQICAAQLHAKIAVFIQSCADPNAPDVTALPIDQTLSKTLYWLQQRAQKTYRRGQKMFWTMMVLCAFFPLTIGYFKMDLTLKGKIGYLFFCGLVVIVLKFIQSKLYPKPILHTSQKTRF